LDNRHKILGVVLLGLAALLLTGCMSEQEEWLQGRWAQGNVHIWTEWSFAEGLYSYSSDYTTIGTANNYESGRYAVKETGEDYIVIELFNRTGNNPAGLEENEKMRIEIDLEADTIHLRNNTYLRVTASTLEALQTAEAP
jgi:hypothetical protein